MNLKALLFSAEGRLNRLSFLLINVLVFIVSTVIAGISYFIFGEGIIETLFSSIISIITTVICIFLIIKRCHDFDKSGYFFIKYILAVIGIAVLLSIFFIFLVDVDNDNALFVPLIFEFIAMLYFIVKPGTEGLNQYGNQPVSLFDLGLGDLKKEDNNLVISDNKLDVM